jgi:hypothetical protein
VPAIFLQSEYPSSPILHKQSRGLDYKYEDGQMWPYEEYTLLENMLVLLIPYLFMLIAYFLLKPLLERRIAEKASELNDNAEEENGEY